MHDRTKSAHVQAGPYSLGHQRKTHGPEEGRVETKRERHERVKAEHAEKIKDERRELWRAFNESEAKQKAVNDSHNEKMKSMPHYVDKLLVLDAKKESVRMLAKQADAKFTPEQLQAQRVQNESDSFGEITDSARLVFERDENEADGVGWYTDTEVKERVANLNEFGERKTNEEIAHLRRADAAHEDLLSAHDERQRREFEDEREERKVKQEAKLSKLRAEHKAYMSAQAKLYDARYEAREANLMKEESRLHEESKALEDALEKRYKTLWGEASAAAAALGVEEV